MEGSPRGTLRALALSAVVLTFAQSLVGAAVRHTDAGMACPDIPLCLGAWIPPFQHWTVVLHFGHRVLGVGLMLLVLWLGHVAFWRGGTRSIRLLGLGSVAVVLAQVALGFFSVYARLAVVPVSLHTLLAALLLTLLTALATLTWAPASAGGRGGEPVAHSTPRHAGA